MIAGHEFVFCKEKGVDVSIKISVRSQKPLDPSSDAPRKELEMSKK